MIEKEIVLKGIRVEIIDNEYYVSTKTNKHHTYRQQSLHKQKENAILTLAKILGVNISIS